MIWRDIHNNVVVAGVVDEKTRRRLALPQQLVLIHRHRHSVMYADAASCSFATVINRKRNTKEVVLAGAEVGGVFEGEGIFGISE